MTPDEREREQQRLIAEYLGRVVAVSRPSPLPMTKRLILAGLTPRPASIQSIADWLRDNRRPVRACALGKNLSALVRAGRIERVRRGWYRVAA